MSMGQNMSKRKCTPKNKEMAKKYPTCNPQHKSHMQSTQMTTLLRNLGIYVLKNRLFMVIPHYLHDQIVPSMFKNHGGITHW